MNEPKKNTEGRAEPKLFGDLSPFKVLTASLSRVPGLKILFGVVALLAILAIARVWSLDRGWTIVGGIAIIFFSCVLLVLAKASTSKTFSFQSPMRVLLWFAIILFMVWGILLTGCVFFKWPVSVQQLPLSPVSGEPKPNPQDPSTKPAVYDPSAFSALRLSTTIDLSRWRKVSPEQMKDHVRVSASQEHTVWQLRKSDVNAKVFRVTVYTPGFEPELIPDANHPLVWAGKVDYESKPGTDHFDKYEYYFDVSNEQVGRPFTIDYEMTRWNTHQGKPHWWHGKVIDYPTELLVYSFVFPKNRPSKSDVLTLKDYNAVTETALVPGTDYHVERSTDDLTVTFMVTSPKYRFGYLYYFDWVD